MNLFLEIKSREVDWKNKIYPTIGQYTSGGRSEGKWADFILSLES